MFFQLLINTVVSGLLLSLTAIGFSLIFNTIKVFHLAHGAFYVMGAYVVAAVQDQFITSLPATILLYLVVMIIVALFAFLIDRLVYQPLAKRKAAQEITLIASIGIYILLVNLFALLYGNENKFGAANIAATIRYGDFVIVPVQLTQLVISGILLLALLFFNRSKRFLQIRAVSGNESVAAILGVNTNIVRMLAMAMGSMLAAITGMLQFYDTGINPYSGMAITLNAAVAVIISGKSVFRGTIISSLLIALLQTMTGHFFSTQWKDGITFILLIVVIIWKTEGIISFKIRVEEK